MDPITLGLITGAGGLLSGLYGMKQHNENRPEMLDYDFNYNPESFNYNPSQGLTGSAEGLREMGGEFMGAYRQMLNPSSAYNQRMFGELRRSASDMSAQLNTNMNQALASRGIGQGGMSSLLSSANTAQVGEDLRKGFVGIQDTSLARAGQFGGLATSAAGQAGNLFSAIDQRRLDSGIFNVTQQNEANRYANQMGYQQAVGNQNALQSWRDAGAQQWMNLGGGLIGAGASMYNPSSSGSSNKWSPNLYPGQNQDY
tara:strand:+ start:5096 stop:5863 length:768 start_codon:yes stop_codon:yes gene_type:complete